MSKAMGPSTNDSQGKQITKMLQAATSSHLVVLLSTTIMVIGTIWAIALVVRDTRLKFSEKVPWVLTLALFPPIGLLLWLAIRQVPMILGRRRSLTTDS
jgi:energy-coupling factor transporter transmembrane protein EcfT